MLRISTVHVGLPLVVKTAVIAVSLFVLGAVIVYTTTRSFAVTSSSTTTPMFQSRAWNVVGESGAVAADVDGNVYAITGNNVSMFSSSQASVDSPGEPTYTKVWSGFSGPSGLAVDSSGAVYVTEYGGGRVDKFSNSLPSGDVSDFMTTWTGLGHPYSVAIDAEGDIVVANDGHSYEMFNQNDLPLGGAPTLTVWDDTAAYVVAIDEDGNVYGGGYSEDSIKVWSRTDPSGTPTYIKTWTGVQSNFKNGLAYANGNIYVGELANGSGGYWYLFPASTPDGDTTSEHQVIGASFDPEQVAVDGSGNVYGASWSGGTVQKFIIPQNLADLTYNDNEIHVALPTDANITAHGVAAPTVADSGNDYPLGLVSATFMTQTIGEEINADVYFQTDLSATAVVPRQFNSTDHTYSNIPDATVTATTWNGQPALKLSYPVQDGGVGDEDGTANGVVVDPVGLAVPVPTLSNTSPADNATDVGTNTNLELTLSHSVTAGAGNIHVYKQGAPDTLVAAISVSDSDHVSYNGSTVTITLPDTLDYSGNYYVEVDSNAFEDANGEYFAGISDGTSWNFSTSGVPADVTTGGANDITQTSVTINGVVQLNNGLALTDVYDDPTQHNGVYLYTSYDTTSSLNWDTTPRLIVSVDDMSLTGEDASNVTFHTQLTGLACGTTYYYRNSWEYKPDADNDAHGWSDNAVQTFTTSNCPALQISPDTNIPGVPNTGLKTATNEWMSIALGGVGVAIIGVALLLARRSRAGE